MCQETQAGCQLKQEVEVYGSLYGYFGDCVLCLLRAAIANQLMAHFNREQCGAGHPCTFCFLGSQTSNSKALQQVVRSPPAGLEVKCRDCFFFLLYEELGCDAIVSQRKPRQKLVKPPPPTLSLLEPSKRSTWIQKLRQTVSLGHYWTCSH